MVIAWTRTGDEKRNAARLEGPLGSRVDHLSSNILHTGDYKRQDDDRDSGGQVEDREHELDGAVTAASN